jgi:hypothetical protein
MYLYKHIYIRLHIRVTYKPHYMITLSIKKKEKTLRIENRYIHINLYVHTYIYKYMYIYKHIYIPVLHSNCEGSLYRNLYTSINVYIYIYMYICIFVYLCKYTNVSLCASK